MEHSRVLSIALCIFLTIFTQDRCKGEDDLYGPTLKFMPNIPGIGEIRKAYCNSACGPARYLFSSILKTYCKLKCPNSTMANLDLDSANPTASTIPTMPTISIIPMIPNFPNISSLLTTVLPTTTTTLPPSTTTIPPPSTTQSNPSPPPTTTVAPASMTKVEDETGGNAIDPAAVPAAS